MKTLIMNLLGERYGIEMQKNTQSVSDETELVFLRLGGYNWTYLESIFGSDLF